MSVNRGKILCREACLKKVSLKKLPKGYYWRTGSYVKRKRVSKNLGIMAEEIGENVCEFTIKKWT